MNKTFLIIAVVILLLTAFLASKKSNQLGTSLQKESTPTAVSQGQVTSTPAVTRTTAQVQGQEKSVLLTISEPSNNATVSTSTITVKGRTVANADVSVNEKDVKADAQGNFLTTISLDEGENIISILAVDQLGNFVEQDLLMTLDLGTQ